MRTGLVILGIAVFAVTVLARFPLGTALGWADLPVGYRGVSGTLWDGEVSGLIVDGERIGDAAIRVHFLPLLTGQVRAEIALSGRGLNGAGTISLRGGRFVARDAETVADLSRFGLADVFGQPLRGRLDATIREVIFAMGDGGCIAADLDVSTDALAQSLGVYGGDGLELAGQGRCEEQDLVIPLAGENANAVIRAELRLQPDGRYRSSLAVTPRQPGFASFLTQVGFRDDGGTFVAERSGMVEAAL